MNKDDDFKQKLTAIGAQIDAQANPFVSVHSVYEQMREAGFTSVEACTVIGIWIANTPRES